MKKIIGFSFLIAMLSMTACQSTTAANLETNSTAELRNTLWKLTTLNGVAIQTKEGKRMASLTLTTEESRARIATACNQGSAGYTVNGNSIKFTPAMSTKMGCEPDAMQQETAFFKAIADTTRFEIKGETLELYNVEGKLLATFHSEYLK